jgi:uncharacterized protein YjbI with pentapeptide repeats
MSKGHTQPVNLSGKPSRSSASSGPSSPNPPASAGGPPPASPPPVAGGPLPNPSPSDGAGEPPPLPGWQIVAILLLVASGAMGVLGFEVSQLWFIGSFIALAGFVILAYWSKLRWSGFLEYTGPAGSKDQYYQPVKTAWDWAGLIIIPLVILLVGSLIASVQQTTSNNELTAQHMNDVHMAQEQLYESELSTYLANMAGLLQQPNVRADNQAGADIRNIARADTFTVLNELVTDPKQITDQQLISDLNNHRLTLTTQPNSKRKARILKFLYESGLISRNPGPNPFPIVNLADADFSYADLRGAQLNGADLAGAIFSHADLSGAFLNSADLSEAKLDYVNLSNAQVTYAQIVGGATSDSEVGLSNANLSGADLSGADLLDTNLTGANFSNTDITGTTLPPNTQSKGAKSQTTWKLTQVNSIETIAFNDRKAHRLTAYGTLDLNSSKLQLIYGPMSSIGTAIVLLPALWSQENCPGTGNYCETAPVTITGMHSVVQTAGQGSSSDPCNNKITIANLQLVADTSPEADVLLCLKGTISGLNVDLTVEFLRPARDTITAIVNARVENPSDVSLSPDIDPASFRLVVLRSIYFPATANVGNQFETLGALIGQTLLSFKPPLPAVRVPIGNGVNALNAQGNPTFGLLGNSHPFDPVRNTPTIMITMIQPTALKVEGEEQPSNDPKNVNIGLWAWSTTVLGSWSYTVVASSSSTE